MLMRTFKLAAVVAAVLGLGRAAKAQYAPMGGPPAAYPSVMAPTYMGESGMAGQSPYAPPAFNPAAYAGMGGPAPMGAMQMGGMPGMPMGGMPGMPIDAGGGDISSYCDPEACGWSHHFFAFGEFLYLRPGNSEVAYAVPISAAGAALATPVQQQVGPVRSVDPDYAAAFRAGFGGVIGPRSTMMLTYTQFDDDTADLVSLPLAGPGVFRSLVSSPNPLAAGADGIDAAAILQTQFHIIDADFKGLAYFTDQVQLSYVVGSRFVNLEQHLSAGFVPGAFVEEVLAETEFDGGGLKLGLDGMRFHPTTQFFFYGKGSASFVAGTFRNRYETITPAAVDTVTSFDVSRLVTILDLEAGLGWQNFTGNLRFSMGYMVSGWYNTVRVNDFINAVQLNSFTDLSDNSNGLFTYDGLSAKIEVLW